MAVAKSIITSTVQKDITCRGLLAVLPASRVGLAAPVLADIQAKDTPMKAAYRQWKAHYDSMAAINGEEEFDAAHDRMLEIGDHMRILPCLTAADVLILLTAQTRWCESCDHDWKHNLPADGRAIVERALV